MNDMTGGVELDITGGMLFIRACFDSLAQLARAGGGMGSAAGRLGVLAPSAPLKARASGGNESAAEGPGSESSALAEQVKKLRLQVQLRDNEINILVSMLKKRESAAGGAAPAGPALSSPRSSQTGLVGAGTAGRASASAAVAAASSDGGCSRGFESGSAPPPLPSAAAEDGLDSASLLADRNKSFEVFRKSYRKNEVIEENKAVLKAKYAAAKGAAERVNGAKARIAEIKSRIEQRRVERAMRAVAQGGRIDESSAEAASDPEEVAARADMEREKTSYKSSYEELRGLKHEIEHLQLLLEQSRQRLQADFEIWLGVMHRQVEGAGPEGVSGRDERAAALARVAIDARLAGRPVPDVASQPVVGGPSGVRFAGGGDGGIGGGAVVVGSSDAARGQPRRAWGAPEDGPGGAPAGVVVGGRSGGPSRGRSGHRADPLLQSAEERARMVMTGNPQADADILAFYQAREVIRGGSGPGHGVASVAAAAAAR